MARMTRTQVTGTTPAGAYSPGIIAEGRFLYVSGQGPLVDGQYTAGARSPRRRGCTLENVGRILKEAGAGFGDVVRCGVFLADIDDFAAMNEVYATFFPEPEARAHDRPGRRPTGRHPGRDRLRGRAALGRRRWVSRRCRPATCTPIDSPVAGSKACMAEWLTVSVIGCPTFTLGGRRDARGERGALGLVVDEAGAALLVGLLGRAHGVARDRRGVDPEEHVHLGAQLLDHGCGRRRSWADRGSRPSAASSKSDGRMPRITLRPS